jgi:hypothetical protein
VPDAGRFARRRACQYSGRAGERARAATARAARRPKTFPTAPTAGPPANSPSEFAPLEIEITVALTPGSRSLLSYARYSG